MKTTRLILGVALFTLGGAGTTMACKYCFGGGAFDGPDPSQASMKMHGTNAPLPGDFPLDSKLGQLPSNVAPAALATPPPAASIVTNAADLRPVTTLPTTPVVFKPTTAPAVARPAASGKTTSTHWADAGLLGLAAVGGIFGWRTRRSAGPVS